MNDLLIAIAYALGAIGMGVKTLYFPGEDPYWNGYAFGVAVMCFFGFMSAMQRLSTNAKSEGGDA